MWTITDRAEHVRTMVLLRSVLLTAAAVALLGFGTFWIVIGTIAIFVGDESDVRYGGLVMVLGGALPALAGAIALYFGVRGFIARSRWKSLFTALRANPSLGIQDIATAFGIPVPQAERMVGGAMRVGILAMASDPPVHSIPPLPHPAVSLQPGSQSFTLPSALSPHAASARPPSIELPSQLQTPIGVQNPSQLVGRLLRGTYQVETMLGAGGMGAVFRARHVRTGRRYALKVLLGDATVESFKRFEREATAASSLGHPGIIAVHDFDRSEEGLPFLVMDLLEGETLAQRLERRRQLLWSDVRRIALEAGDALAVAHEAGLLHRDIKPGNLFLASTSGKAERVVLLDFGLVKPLDPRASRVTASGAALGTPLYMAPEQALGESLDVRTDVYGLGAVVFEMVTGAPPFLDSSAAAVYARLLSQNAPPPSSIAPRACPAGLDDVLGRALAKSPAARYLSVRAFLVDLAQLRPPTAGSTVLV